MTLALLTAQIGNYHDARYRAVASSGTRFTVLSIQNGADFTEFLASRTSDYPVTRLFPGRADYLRAIASGQVWPAVQSALSVLDPQVVAVAGWSMPESFAAIAWARRNRRRLVMLSDSQSIDAERSGWRERVKAQIVRLCDAALVAGPSHVDYIESLGIARSHTFMGYDVVDNAHFADGADAARAIQATERKRLGMPDRYLVASARFIPKKNLPRLIRAYGRAIQGRATAPDLVILGDGPERQLIQATIRQVDLAHRVHLPGFRDYADLPALYGLAEGFLHVSTSEQWGLVINEASSAGVPVIASSACGATGALVEDGVTGFVVAADSEASITDALARLMNLDGPSRFRMGLAARRRAGEWGLDRFVDGLLSACRAALACPPRKLAPWDAILLRALSRRAILGVQ